MAVKIRLKRMGKIRDPRYRVVVVDSRKKRDGRVIEEVGVYQPTENPSYINLVSDRVQYWLGVGAQPSDAVYKLIKITGDYHQFKGLKGVESTLKVKDTNAATVAKEAAVKAAADDAEKRKAAAAKAKADQEAAEAAAKSMRERALADARAIVAESFGENAPAFIVRAAESAATGEDFDPDTLRTEVTEAAAALTVDPAAPSVGAYTITVNESDLGRMSAAEIAARINDHYFKG